MDAPKPRKSRWFRFSLRTMFVLVTMVCVWLGWEVSVSRFRGKTRSLIEVCGGQAFHGDRFRLNFMNDWKESHIWLPETTQHGDVEVIRKAFPEARITFHKSKPNN
jgi:hypothetical protein